MSGMIMTALHVAPNQTIDSLLPEVRQREDHVAIVVNKFGYRLTMVEAMERALVKLRVEPNADAEPAPNDAHGGARSENGGGADVGQRFPQASIAGKRGDSDGQEVKTTDG